MKKVRIISICLCIVSLLVFASCGNNIKSDETYRSQYIAAYRGASLALDVSNSPNKLKNMMKRVGFNDNSNRAVAMSAKNDFEDCYTTADDNMLKGTRAFVYFLYLLYNNNVPITQRPIELDCDYIINKTVVQDNNITLLSDIDLINNRIIGNIIGVSAEPDAIRDTDEFYLHIEIDFDFENFTVGDFTLDMIGVIGNDLSFENGVSCICKNGEIYSAGQSDFGSQLDRYVEFIREAYYNPYKSLTENSIKTNKNYSKEYTEAMNKFVN